MSGVLVAAALVASGMTIDPATPQPTGFYIAGDVGLQDGRLAVDEGYLDGSYDLSEDWSAHLRVGYRISDTWRVEAEAAQRTADIGEVCFAWLSCLSSEDYLGRDLGDFERTSLHLNVLYDLSLADWALRPFVGAGVGATQVAMSPGSLN
jgi:OOP family OmpA-OmpF porin